ISRQRDPLDRHLAVEQFIARTPHHPAAALAQTLEQAVAPENAAVRPGWTLLERVICQLARTQHPVPVRGRARRRHPPHCRRPRRPSDRAAWAACRSGVDEGRQRLHRIPGFAAAGAPPAGTSGKLQSAGELATLAPAADRRSGGQSYWVPPTSRKRSAWLLS